MVTETGVRDGYDLLVTLELDNHNLVSDLQHLAVVDLPVLRHQKVFFQLYELTNALEISSHFRFNWIYFCNLHDIHTVSVRSLGAIALLII